MRALAAALCAGCIGQVTPAQCAVDQDCGASKICYAAECHPGTRELDGGVCPIVQARWSDINSNFFQVGCFTRSAGTTNCHSDVGAAASSGLSLEGDPYGRLVGHASVDGGFVLVKPGDPDNSYLSIKLKLTAAHDDVYGSGMPPEAPGQTCAQAQEAVRQWIAAGAVRN